MAKEPTQMAQWGLSQQDWNEYCNVQKLQKDFHDELKKTKIPENQKRILDCRSPDELASYWIGIAEQTKSKFDSRREEGWRYWAKKYQSFATGAGQFMQNFQPIVNMAQSGAGPYSAIAVGTVGLLFSVAQSKSQTDDMIASAIAGVKDRMPGFRVYEEIYHQSQDDQNRLRGKIIVAYTGFMELTIEATKYYLKSGFHRWLKAAFDPDKFRDLSIKVQTLIGTVKWECEVLLTCSVNQIRLQNIQLLQQNAELIKKVESLQQNNANMNLVTIQKLLGLREWSIEGESRKLEGYEKDLEAERALRGRFGSMNSGSIAKYKQETTAFKEWDKSTESSMLLVIAANHENVDKRGSLHSWMSPMALDLIQNVRDKAWIHVSYVFDIWKRVSIYDAFPELLFQLFRWQPPSLCTGDFLASFSAIMEKYWKLQSQHKVDDDEESDEMRKEILSEAAVATIKLFPSDQIVFMVIDRIDRCESQDQADILNILVKMMDEASCSVKIFAVANLIS